jgi:hypothetical protein
LSVWDKLSLEDKKSFKEKDEGNRFWEGEISCNEEIFCFSLELRARVLVLIVDSVKWDININYLSYI